MHVNLTLPHFLGPVVNIHVAVEEANRKLGLSTQHTVLLSDDGHLRGSKHNSFTTSSKRPTKREFSNERYSWC
jgi:hypothetical protein